jgi:hypothetical protein
VPQGSSASGGKEVIPSRDTVVRGVRHQAVPLSNENPQRSRIWRDTRCWGLVSVSDAPPT